MAHVEKARRAGQHHPRPLATQVPGAQSGREHLAVHARQLAVEPDLYILREHPRTLLPSLEQAHRSAMAHHVHRNARVGQWVLSIEDWYKAHLALARPTRAHFFQI